MTLADARAMVAQLFWYAPQAKQTEIARYMVQAGVCALHAAWELYGRVKGLPCVCTPCLSEPPIGSEVIVRILLQGRAPEAEVVRGS